jgi:hypothetical protein
MTIFAKLAFGIFWEIYKKCSISFMSSTLEKETLLE